MVKSSLYQDNDPSITLLQGATRDGRWGIPLIFQTTSVPNKLLPFDKALRCHNKNQWVHFYINDSRFRRIMREPDRYLNVLSAYQGVISPDFSVRWNEPPYKQLQAVADGKAFGSWLQRNGVDVIPNVRWGKPDTYEFAFDGVESGGTIAVGTLGCLQDHETREVFGAGLIEMLKHIRPKTIVAYGGMDNGTARYIQQMGISIKQFPCASTEIHMLAKKAA